MKLLNEYLSTKIRNPKDNGFPDTPVNDDIVNFLKSKGFDEPSYDGREWPYNFLKEQNQRSFILRATTRNNDWWIRFMDPQQDAKHLCCFFCRCNETGNLGDYTDVGYVEYEDGGRQDKVFHDFKAFKDFVDKYFGW